MECTKLTIMLSLLLHFVVSKHVMNTSGTIEDLIRLTDTMFSNYSMEIRPVYNLSNTLTVTTALMLFAIQDVDEVSGTIALSISLGLLWNDFRLAWNPRDYGGINYTVVKSSKVWQPSVFLISSAADLDKFHTDDFDASIFSNGDVIISPGKLVKSSCTVDMTNFPTDSQTCSLLFVPWGYSASMVKLSYNLKEFYMDYFSPNGEWHVSRTLVENSLSYGEYASVIAYTMFLTRKPGYFIISLVIPPCILNILQPFVFVLPASSGERISYIITMFLSLAIYLTIIGDNMPKVSEPMAGISYFLLASMLYSCKMIILTIFTLRCEDYPEVNNFPNWLIRVVSRFKRRNKGTATDIMTPTDPDDIPSQHLPVLGNNVPDKRQMDMVVKENARQNNSVEKRDVMYFIDMSFFCASLTEIVALITGFTLYYFR